MQQSKGWKIEDSLKKLGSRRNVYIFIVSKKHESGLWATVETGEAKEKIFKTKKKTHCLVLHQCHNSYIYCSLYWRFFTDFEKLHSRFTSYFLKPQKIRKLSCILDINTTTAHNWKSCIYLSFKILFTNHFQLCLWNLEEVQGKSNQTFFVLLSCSTQISTVRKIFKGFSTLYFSF